MQKGQLSRTILVVALIVISVIGLLPTFKVSSLQNQQTELIQTITEQTGLTTSDVKTALGRGDLETVIRETESENVEAALDNADSLIDLKKDIDKNQKWSLKQGLDLQGGTYLVYEADLPQLLRNVAKNSDQQLEDIINATVDQVDEEGADFFNALVENFNVREAKLNRYFGKRGQSENDIVADLKDEAEDAVNRTLEVLRNRIDQFGVTEPSITKQGARRIEIELAGVTDIQDAKNIIGQTALLEFKLVKESDLITSVLTDIDRVLRAKRRGEQAADTAAVEDQMAEREEGEQADDEEVSLSDLFGDSEEDQDVPESDDETVVVDKNTVSEYPFTSLLRQIPGYNFIGVPQQNVRAVKRILQLPEVLEVIPADAEFHFGYKPVNFGEESYSQLYLLKKEPDLLGKYLVDAQSNIASGGRSLGGGWKVDIELNNEGDKIFARLTGMNVDRQLAIVLDGNVASAPNITGKIIGGRAEITGSFTMEEANQLALVLRSGALPAPVYAITENTVGPSLGQDSIDKGRMSIIIGLSLVALFMVIYYGASGFVADFALILNILFMFAILAGFHATLTLPGIAGIILTVGMAVDANVLIFERIREELRNGKTVRTAIDAGYGRAFTTILDANVTTLITAIVLYYFGTGTIRGFALTLSIGIVASMFTAIVVTRLVFDLITSRFAVKKLSI